MSDPTATPQDFGVGARITAAVMADDYAELILGALHRTDPRTLEVATGDVSTWLGGDEAELQRWVTDFTGELAATGRHASVALQLSRGCPGEVVCELPGGAGPRVVELTPERTTGTWAAAEWALYPLADTGVAGVEPDHMRDIHAAIDLARRNGTFVASEHYVTRLEGDLGAILATVFGGWLLVGRTVQHVVCHVTISLNSPSHGARS